MRKLHYHVGKAGHFARWERDAFAQWFELVDEPAPDALLLSFGPDVLEEAAVMPALARFAVLFPGFSFNPVRDAALRERQLGLLRDRFMRTFINPGPLEIAYAGLSSLVLYPFSVDADAVGFRGPRTRLDRLVHVSHDNPQKDWRRSASIMRKTGLANEVFPPRDAEALAAYDAELAEADERLRRAGVEVPPRLPSGYVTHELTIERYNAADGFVHVARDVRHPEFIDGKYTASLIEAGVSGCLLFWHDTWGLGNGLETVFELPLSTQAAAERILDIRSSVDIAAHSAATRDEMVATFSTRGSVAIRAEAMLAAVDGGS